MKSSKIISKILLIVIATALMIIPVSAFAAETALTHTEHIDTTGDGVCDIDGCDKKLPCTEHIDIDGDGLCDIKDCNACKTHKDANSDGVCDAEGCDAEVPVDEKTIGAKVLKSIKIFVIGMLGIFIVVGLIILSIYALNYLINKTQRTKSGEQ